MLDLVRIGLTNEEIAGRLGISPDTAKFHVSQILAKLGVGTREEAAVLATSGERNWWQRLGAWTLAAKAALAAAALVLVAALGVLAWAVLSNSDTTTTPDESDVITPDHVLYVSSGDGIDVIDPVRREVIHTIAVGSDPEVAIAPDGNTIYLTDGGPTGDFTLSVIDARGWRVLASAPAPDRITNISPGTSGMAVSADGRYVYVHKWQVTTGQFDEGNGSSAPASDHWWDPYDTTANVFLPNQPRIPNCGIARVFPAREQTSQLAVLCDEVNAFVLVDLSGSTISTPVFDANACDPSRDQFAADAVQAQDGTIYVVTRGGCVQAISVAGKPLRAFQVDLPQGSRVPFNDIALAGDKLLLAVGPGTQSDDLTREVWTVDTATGAHLSTIAVGRDVASIATSPDGRVLYAAAPESENLTAYDLETGEQIWQMPQLNHPSVIWVAPRASTLLPQRTPVPPTPTLAPPATPNPSDIAIRPCTAADLTVTRLGSGAATGHTIVSYAAQNVSADACRVLGAGTLQVLGPGGEVLDTGRPCGSFASSGDCSNTIAVLSPGGPAAEFTVSWSSALVIPEATCPESPASVAVELPDDGGPLSLPLEQFPLCPVPEGASAFGFNETSTPTPTPRELAIRPCTADDLVVSEGHDSGAGGNIIVGFGAQNVSSTACRVPGAPTLELLGVDGELLAAGTPCASIFSSADCPNVVAVLLPGPSPQPSVGPYEAGFTVSWENPLDFGETPCPESAASLALDLRDGGGRLLISGEGIPIAYCPLSPGVSEFDVVPTASPSP